MRRFNPHHFYTTFLISALLLVGLHGKAGGAGFDLYRAPNVVVPNFIAFKADESGRGQGRFQIAEKNARSGDRICLNRLQALDSSNAMNTQLASSGPICNSNGVFDIKVEFSSVGNSRINFDLSIQRARSTGTRRGSQKFFSYSGSVLTSYYNSIFRLLSPVAEVFQKSCHQILSEGAAGKPSYRVIKIPNGATFSSGIICAGSLSTGTAFIEVSDYANRKLYQMIQFAPQNVSISMDVKKWMPYGSGLPRYPTPVGENSFVINFPDIRVGDLGYLTQFTKGSIRSKFIRSRIEIRATPGTTFNHFTEPFNTGTFPAHVRTYVQRGRFETTGDNDRWWSNPIAVDLKNGKFEMVNIVDPSQWSNVNGKAGNADSDTLEGFRRAFREVHEFGYTFGGGFFFGHGVRTENGSASFQLDEISFIDVLE